VTVLGFSVAQYRGKAFFYRGNPKIREQSINAKKNGENIFSIKLIFLKAVLSQID